MRKNLDLGHKKLYQFIVCAAQSACIFLKEFGYKNAKLHLILNHFEAFDVLRAATIFKWNSTIGVSISIGRFG